MPGKMKRQKIGAVRNTSSLIESYLDGGFKIKHIGKQMKKTSKEEEKLVDDKSSRRILKAAREQLEEIEETEGLNSSDSSDEGPEESEQPSTSGYVPFPARKATDPADSDDDSEYEDVDEKEEKSYDTLETSKEDELALEMFKPQTEEEKRVLSDIISEKMTEKMTEIETQLSEIETVNNPTDKRLEKVFRDIGKIMASYRSGKVPIPFKLLPAAMNWAHLMELTEPRKWSAAAMYQATKIWTGNMPEIMAIKFFSIVLLPRVRDDIAEYRKLNPHLHQALRKALYKPKAFFKGFILPLLTCDDPCTLREAAIIGSVLTKTHIPALHCGALMLKIAEMDYNGANSIFLRIFIEKNYSLAYRVIDALVGHFMRFLSSKEDPPVLWHQCLQAFIQRYKQDIAPEQREQLYAVMDKHFHSEITPLIRKELEEAKYRDECIEQPAMVTE